MSGWIAYHRSDEAEELQARHPNAFLLLAQIARRARWKDCPIMKLKAGQALVGDWKKAGIPSEMAYRTAKDVLSDCGLATFQGTTRGTIATLTGTSVFSLSEIENNGRGNDQATDEERTNNGRATTNVQGKKETRRTRKQEAVEFPPELSGDDFNEAWSKWETHRKEIKKPLTPTSTAQQLKDLATMGKARSIEAIFHSIAKGWQGIFEPPTSANGPTNQPKALDLSNNRRARSTANRDTE